MIFLEKVLKQLKIGLKLLIKNKNYDANGSGFKWQSQTLGTNYKKFCLTILNEVKKEKNKSLKRIRKDISRNV